MNEFLLILGMFAVTFGVRYPVLAFASRIHMPDIIARGLKFVPAAVLSALIVPSVLFPPSGVRGLSWQNGYLAAALLAGFIAYRTKNLLLTIVIGMAFFLLYRWFLGGLL